MKKLYLSLILFTVLFFLNIYNPLNNVLAQGTCDSGDAGLCGTCQQIGFCQVCEVGYRCTESSPGNYTCELDSTCPWKERCTPSFPPGMGEFSGIDTAIGCIPVITDDITPFVQFFLKWAIGIAGGIAFLLIIYAGFLITTSGGNPQKLAAGKELLTAALMGLFLLIFSVFILELLGVDILKIPGF